MPLYKHVTFMLCRETFVYKMISPSVAYSANENKRTAELPFPLLTHLRSYYLKHTIEKV